MNFYFKTYLHLKGVGQKTKKLLKKKKIEKISDLMCWNLPQGLQIDQITNINKLEIGKITTIKVQSYKI